MLRIISSVWNSPAGTMSTPPPRTMFIRSELWNAGRMSVSDIERHLTRGWPLGTETPPTRTSTLRSVAAASGDARRKVPSVDALLRSEPGQRAALTVGRALLKRTLTLTLDEVRAAAAAGVDPPTDDEILARAVGRAAKAAFGLTPVINATGVIL